MQAQHDFEINEKAEKEIEVLMRHLAYQDQTILQMQERLEDMIKELRPR